MVACAAGAALLLRADLADAYIGPGAGFALISSFGMLVTTAVLAGLSLLLWPVRALVRRIRRGRAPRPWINRLIVVGLDGLDPNLTDRFLAEGKLPHLQALARRGCYRRLGTTFPSVSPVAWSSFSTGTHPAKHGIYDFLSRDRRSYLPTLSSTFIGRVERWLPLGRFRIPLGRPEIRQLRKSRPFWSILGDSQIWSTILRVPITFPPDRFYGAQLSAMCVPDLLGTQGTFQLFTTREASEEFQEGGIRVPLSGSNGSYRARLVGPEHPFREDATPLSVPLVLAVDRAAGRVDVEIDGTTLSLEPGRASDWVHVGFRAAPGVRIGGICRLLVTELDDHVSLYVTPISLDPAKPAMPISHPSYYATYLERVIGPYATLGLAEDTWAMNERVIGDEAFLEQTYAIDDERQAMFFTALDRMRHGALVCVFDATDRIQHMFWRYLEAGHPAGKQPPDPNPQRDAIERVYRRNDELVGRVVEQIRDDDVLMVLSDHGFTSFRRGVNLNRWLLEQGYLALKEGCDGNAAWLRDVDWTRTRAYGLGLTGLYLNVAGRESQGIVAPGAAAASLKAEIVARLSGLPDEACAETAIVEAFDTASLYRGPFLDDAPDILLGFNRGYRTSWDAAMGIVGSEVFQDNRKCWSGDHCVDPRLVPGVFLSNVPIEREDPRLIDIAPTALRLFGLEPPRHMDGESLLTRPPAGPVPRPGADGEATGDR